MATNSQRPKGRDGALSSLNMAINALNLAKEAAGTTQAKAAFNSVSDLLTMIRDLVIDKADYVELGLTCADVCEALNRGTDRRRADQPSRSTLEAVEKLRATVNGIQTNIIKRGRRSAISRRFHAKDDKEAIATWRLDLDGILHVFNTELRTNARTTVVSDVRCDISNTKTTVPDRHNISSTYPIVSDIYRNKLKGRENADGQHKATHARAPGESPPPLGRDTHGTPSDIRRDLVNTQTMVSDLHRNMLKSQEKADDQHRSTQNSISGEPPPPPPRACFGRDELIEKIVSLAENLVPIALIGPGGIGKTSVALTVLHEDRIKQRFGDNRWFIRCDQFPASRTHFLRRLSKVIGAGIENPEDLTPLRRYLSSKEMLIILDNAESVLDIQGTNAQEIHTVVDELSQFTNICLCITSRITTIPPDCETPDIPTLSAEAAHDAFYRIYKHGERSDLVGNILDQLDFHPLSVTLLATVAQRNGWDTNRLTKEWERQRTGVLHVQHSRSLATAIELSLASPMFQGLGPDARGVLGVIAFFPQGVNEENINWLFPTVPNGPNMFDKFCTLSLTYRSNGFIAMLAPLRDYLRPKDPASSSLLCTTKECYFARLSVDELCPDRPSFSEARWITSEDVNVEHLLDTFTSIDANSEGVWVACAKFMDHLYPYKPRLVVLGPKIEALPDDHPSKAECLLRLSWLFESMGNNTERRRLLTHALKLWREQGYDYQVAETLRALADANRLMGQSKEGIQQANEGVEIFERLGDTVKQARVLVMLAWLLRDDGQLEAAEGAASHAVDIIPEESEQYLLCKSHRVLGHIYHSKGEAERAIHHSEVALRIASSLNSVIQMFWIHHELAEVFFKQGMIDNAHAHVERAKTYAADNQYHLGRAIDLQAYFWYGQGLLKEAKSGALRATDIYAKLGATQDLKYCRELLQRIDEGMEDPGRFSSIGSDHGLLDTVTLPRVVY